MTKPPVLILGAASEVGKALARRFAFEGHPVQLALRDPGRLKDYGAELASAHKVEVTQLAYEATDIDGADAFFAALSPRPRIVISVTGLLGEQAETENDPKRIAEIVAVNFTGPSVILEAAAKHLASDGEAATVIGISSVAGDRGRAKNYWYGAAKAGFSAVLSGLRQKYAGSNLKVITIKPGFIDTPMTAGMDLPGPLVASPEEVADRIFSAWQKGKSVVYGWKWRLVMTIIRLLPEPIFMKTRF